MLYFLLTVKTKSIYKYDKAIHVNLISSFLFITCHIFEGGRGVKSDLGYRKFNYEANVIFWFLDRKGAKNILMGAAIILKLGI